MQNFWKTLLMTMAHAAVGAGSVAVATQVPVISPLITAHVDPLTGAMIASVLSSVASAFAPPPHQVGQEEATAIVQPPRGDGK